MGNMQLESINKQKVILKNTKQKPTKSNSSKSFNNFEGRNYTKEEYDNIENKLLGWE